MNRARVAVLISGTGSNMAALLYASRTEDCPYEIVLVASNNPEAPGLRLADAEGVATFALSHKGMTKTDHEAALDQALASAESDYVALAGYMRVLSSGFVERWEGRMLNIHPSLLPAYKGLDTHARALDAGDAQAGCSVHLVTPELDDGPVLGQVAVAVLPGDTAATLAARVLIAEHQLYPRVLAGLVSQESDPDWLHARVNDLALALPETEARPSHGSPGWRVGGKYFAIFSRHHHGEQAIAVLVKTSGQDELAALIERNPEAYYRPAYYGASGWVGIVLNRKGVDWAHVADWLRRSWSAVAPKRLTRLIDAAGQF